MPDSCMVVDTSENQQVTFNSFRRMQTAFNPMKHLEVVINAR
jgi:hypothetical protein